MRNLSLAFLLAIWVAGCSAQNNQVKDGDIIFIVNPSGQGKAIQLATKSKFTHVGVIFYEKGKPMVYHAVQPVSVNTLEEFKNMSVNGKYEIKRLKNQSLLTKENISAMLELARNKVGTNYDIYLAWDDKELYCSEYVWKLFKEQLKIEVGKLRSLKEFDLSSPQVKEIMARRYGNSIPYEEKMISPGDMFNCELLE